MNQDFRSFKKLNSCFSVAISPTSSNGIIFYLHHVNLKICIKNAAFKFFTNNPNPEMYIDVNFVNNEETTSFSHSR